MREPAVKNVLFWCDQCNIPLIGQRCGCGADGRSIPLLQPYDLRPALKEDYHLLNELISDKYGNIPLPKVILLNKTGGTDRTDLVIIHGNRFGWLSFDPVKRLFDFDIAPEGLPFLLSHAKKGIIPLEEIVDFGGKKVRIGGKKFPLTASLPDGTILISYKGKYGTGIIRDGNIRIKEIIQVTPVTPKNPDWDDVIAKNRYHLKNLERSAIRTIKQHLKDRPTANVSFSGGKDSTATLHLARKAGVSKAFFIDTGLEFPETISFIESSGVEIIRKGGNFWQAVDKAGPPGKDNRWCCKLLKLNPLKIYLADIGPCVTIQGNRWYESWNRAGLDETSQNPANPLQLNISPIRSWRALEVYLYLWWQDVEINPLYDMGLERIGCYLCPAMLESEYEQIRKTHPDLTSRWDEFIDKWAAVKGLPEEYCTYGLWRWKALPPKMRELCQEKGIRINNDFTLKTGPKRTPTFRKPEIPHPPTPDQINHRKESVPDGVIDVDTIRNDFPILGEVVYLDNAATSFSPELVIAAQIEFEHRYRSNVGRGIHRFTRIATQRYWHAHEKISSFIGGEGGITVFTRNATEAINMVAKGLEWNEGDIIVTSILEHHSNLLPWKELEKNGVVIRVIGLNPDYSLNLEELKEAMTDSVRMVAISHASNVLGIITPVKEISRICREHNALLLIDAAQSVPHFPVNVRDLGCDFLCFSGHKMLGPTGTGVLWMKENTIRPLYLGGGMVESVTSETITLMEGYEQFEAGTPNVSGGIGLGAAVSYLQSVGMEKIHRYESMLTDRLISGLALIDDVKVYTTKDSEKRVGVVSFTIENLHPHEIAQYLDEQSDILVRSGFHCCQPLMEYLHLPEGTVRASLSFYNTIQEIDLLVAAIKDLVRSIEKSEIN